MSRPLPIPNLKTDNFLEITQKLIHSLNVLGNNSYNTYCLNKDENGKYQRVELKDSATGKLLCVSELSSRDINGNYGKLSITYYSETDSQVVAVELWDLKYDEEGHVISSVMEVQKHD